MAEHQSLDKIRHDELKSYQGTAGQLSVYELFQEQTKRSPEKLALIDRKRRYTYKETLDRVNALATSLADRGITMGDRVAVLAENCTEYLEIHLAMASLGAIVACQNWRLTIDELDHSIQLVSPKLLFFSDRFAQRALSITEHHGIEGIKLGSEYEQIIASSDKRKLPDVTDLETGLLILYTSGTTGPAKAAVISQRALISRMILLRLDLDVESEDAFIAWSPMFHMGGSEHSISTLMMGGTVYVSDGFDVEYIVKIISQTRLGWLILVPATIERLIEELDRTDTTAVGIKRIGAMADLLPKKQIAEVSARLNSPFLNSFGATETGIAPASGGEFAPGVTPHRLSKSLNSLCAMRLIDAGGLDVPDGETGEALVKGPTLFSGYWNNSEANARDFTNGWFRMGDLFIRNGDGTVDFAGRAKYLIKSGGENIYPAEIEQILLADPKVRDAIVVSSPDQKWGEVPVAVIATDESDLEALKISILEKCRSALGSYKIPKAIHFIDFEKLPRSSSGKIVRSDVEKWLKLLPK